MAVPRAAGAVECNPLFVAAVGRIRPTPRLSGGFRDEDITAIVELVDPGQAVVEQGPVRSEPKHRIGPEHSGIENTVIGPTPASISGVSVPRLTEVVVHRVELTPADADSQSISRMHGDGRFVGRITEDVGSARVGIDLNAGVRAASPGLRRTREPFVRADRHERIVDPFVSPRRLLRPAQRHYLEGDDPDQYAVFHSSIIRFSIQHVSFSRVQFEQRCCGRGIKEPLLSVPETQTRRPSCRIRGRR